MKRPKILLLFETTGLAAAEFESQGFSTVCVDLENVPGKWDSSHKVETKHTEWLNWDILKREKSLIKVAKECVAMGGFPSCTDLAVSGARHFAAKREKNPNFQEEAVHLARSVERIGDAAGIPWFLENPVSVLATMWRKSDLIFQPHEYGGYLPKNDKHPLYPEYIAARDAYPKRTCFWTSEDFQMPGKIPVKVSPGYSTQFKKLGGKSPKTKRIRSATPRGVMQAMALKWKDELWTLKTG